MCVGTRATSLQQQATRFGSWPVALALFLVAFFALATRLPTPWRMGVSNDEMHHLQSWRNRYGTDDIYPLFLSRLKQNHAISDSRLLLVERVYRSSTIFQHGLLILADPQPPIYPTLAEFIASVSHSNLIALRLPSLLASIAAIYLMFLIGRKLSDPLLGGWLAALIVVCQLARIYAGIGRPYAMSQCAVLATLYVFLLDRDKPAAPPYRFLICALLAQAMQWPAWLVISPMVFLVLLRWMRQLRSPLAALKQCWWYPLLSVLLLAELAVQLRNPTIDRMAGVSDWRLFINHFAIGSPMSDLGSFGPHALQTVGMFWLLTTVAGGVLVLRRSETLCKQMRWQAVGLILVAIASFVGMIAAGSPLRLMNTYGLAPIILSGITLRTLFKPTIASAAGIVMLLLVGAGIQRFHPLDPYIDEFPGEQSYTAVARTLARELGPNDAWTAWPYFRADCLYPAARLPAPGMFDRFSDVESFIEQKSARDSCYLYLLNPDASEIPARRPIEKIDFPGGSLLLRYGKSISGATAP